MFYTYKIVPYLVIISNAEKPMLKKREIFNTFRGRVKKTDIF